LEAIALANKAFSKWLLLNSQVYLNYLYLNILLSLLLGLSTY